MKYLLALGILVAALLLTPATVLGYYWAEPSIGYDENTNTIYASAYLGPPDYYDLLYNGIPSMYIVIADYNTNEGWYYNDWSPFESTVGTSGPAAGDTTYYAYTRSYVTYPYCELWYENPLACQWWSYYYNPEAIMYSCDGWALCYQWVIESSEEWMTAYTDPDDYAPSNNWIYVPAPSVHFTNTGNNTVPLGATNPLGDPPALPGWQ